ncbi:hypothetical protein [Dendrosporobacter sp. 1207_IL3150]|uniref:hypothetical protein n=1 Tax=Dendrosporobacter sp. 1207_IL3150 TaxID=3084054 RepID=UPI002FD9196A
MSEVKEKETIVNDCSSAGKGFARTEDNDIVAENCPLPSGQGKGFARTDADEEIGQACGINGKRDCSTAGKGFARTDSNDIAPEDCALPDGPGKGFAKTEQPK